MNYWKVTSTEQCLPLTWRTLWFWRSTSCRF